MRFWLSIAATALTLVLASGPLAEPSATHPVLRALRGTTTGVQGTGFRPGERVTMTLFVAARARETKRVVASKAGSFIARFVYEVPACTPWLVRAVGAVSGRVWYRSLARECSPK